MQERINIRSKAARPGCQQLSEYILVILTQLILQIACAYFTTAIPLNPDKGWALVPKAALFWVS